MNEWALLMFEEIKSPQLLLFSTSHVHFFTDSLPLFAFVVIFSLKEEY